MTYDLIVANGTVIDPENGVHGVFDLGVCDGRVAAVEQELPRAAGKRIMDAAGKVVIPGIIDMHVHTGFTGRGGEAAMRMMVKAGTVTAMDCGGPLEEFYEYAAHEGAGMNMACLQMIKPGWNVDGVDPAGREAAGLIERSMSEGALGMKILGGHFPMTPDATRRFVEASNERRAFVAFHVGTTEHPIGNFDAFREAVDIAKSLSLDIVHVNSYCRGQILGDPVTESLEALKLLEANRNVFGESYLSVFAATPCRCIGGEFESNGPRNSLRMGGYDENERGLKQAIMDGFASVVYPRGDANIRLDGEDGVTYFDEQRSEVACTFPVTPASTRFLLATQKDTAGRFIVDALATDGGALPRNFLVEKGTALVQMDFLSWEEYVTKTSTTPARILGLKRKGHLGVGADADMTILEGTSGRAYASVNAGRIIMLDGMLLGEGTTVITTSRGAAAVRQKGLECYVADIEDGWFFGGRPQEPTP